MCKRSLTSQFHHIFRPGSPAVIILLLCSVLAGSSAATPPSIKTSLTTDRFTVGDKIRFSVSITVPKNSSVTPPETEFDFGEITVKEWNLHKTERTESDSLVYDYLITTYVPEPCTIPALPFFIETQGATDTLTTDPVPLVIISVLQGDSIRLMGFRSPLSAGKKPQWWLWILIIAGTLVLITVSTILLVKHFRKPPPPPPPVPPYEEAIDALRELGVKKYLQRGLVREYVFELSDIFKRYIGRRFNCNAMDFTTEEMFDWSSTAGLSKKLHASIDWFFRTSDPVKFARFIPDNDTVERFEREIHFFLDETKPVVGKEEESVTPEGETGTSESPSKNGGDAA